MTFTCDEVSLLVVAPNESSIDPGYVVGKPQLREGPPLLGEVGHHVIPIKQPILLSCENKGHKVILNVD